MNNETMCLFSLYKMPCHENVFHTHQMSTDTCTLSTSIFLKIYSFIIIIFCIISASGRKGN